METVEALLKSLSFGPSSNPLLFAPAIFLSISLGSDLLLFASASIPIIYPLISKDSGRS